MHQELHELQQTSQGAGYHSSNNATMEDTNDIANHATSPTADRATVETLKATKIRLLKEIIAVNETLVKLTEKTKFCKPNPPVRAATAITKDPRKRAPFTVFVVAVACGIRAALAGAKSQGTRTMPPKTTKWAAPQPLSSPNDKN